MSFDLFLMTMPADTFDRSIVEQAFAAFADDPASDEWALVEPDGKHHGAYMSVAASSRVSGFSVNRPPFIDEFWEAVFYVLRHTRTFLVWPAPKSPSYCVANPDWESYLGDDPLGMGRPAFVASAAEIPGVIEASF
jgi:hypothetical protein